MTKDERYQDNVILKKEALQELLTNIKNYPIIDIDYVEENELDLETPNPESTIWNRFTEGTPCIKITYGDVDTDKGKIALADAETKENISRWQKDIINYSKELAIKEQEYSRWNDILKENNRLKEIKQNEINIYKDGQEALVENIINEIKAAYGTLDTPFNNRESEIQNQIANEQTNFNFIGVSLIILTDCHIDWAFVDITLKKDENNNNAVVVKSINYANGETLDENPELTFQNNFPSLNLSTIDPSFENEIHLYVLRDWQIAVSHILESLQTLEYNKNAQILAFPTEKANIEANYATTKQNLEKLYQLYMDGRSWLTAGLQLTDENSLTGGSEYENTIKTLDTYIKEYLIDEIEDKITRASNKIDALETDIQGLNNNINGRKQNIQEAKDSIVVTNDQRLGLLGHKYVKVGGSIVFYDENNQPVSILENMADDQSLGTFRVNVNGNNYEVPIFGIAGDKDSLRIRGHLYPAEDNKYDIGKFEDITYELAQQPYDTSGNIQYYKLVTEKIPATNYIEGINYYELISDNYIKAPAPYNNTIQYYKQIGYEPATKFLTNLKYYDCIFTEYQYRTDTETNSQEIITPMHPNTFIEVLRNDGNGFVELGESYFDYDPNETNLNEQNYFLDEENNRWLLFITDPTITQIKFTQALNNFCIAAIGGGGAGGNRADPDNGSVSSAGGGGGAGGQIVTWKSQNYPLPKDSIAYISIGAGAITPSGTGGSTFFTLKNGDNYITTQQQAFGGPGGTAGNGNEGLGGAGGTWSNGNDGGNGGTGNTNAGGSGVDGTSFEDWTWNDQAIRLAAGGGGGAGKTININTHEEVYGSFGNKGLSSNYIGCGGFGGGYTTDTSSNGFNHWQGWNGGIVIYADIVTQQSTSSGVFVETTINFDPNNLYYTKDEESNKYYLSEPQPTNDIDYSLDPKFYICNDNPEEVSVTENIYQDYYVKHFEEVENSQAEDLDDYYVRETIYNQITDSTALDTDNITQYYIDNLVYREATQPLETGINYYIQSQNNLRWRNLYISGDLNLIDNNNSVFSLQGGPEGSFLQGNGEGNNPIWSTNLTVSSDAEAMRYINTTDTDPAAGQAYGTAILEGSITTPGGIAAGKSIKGYKVYSAVFNDYAECRKTINLKAGQVVIDKDDGTLECTSSRLQPGAQVISDTFGHLLGEMPGAETPIAVAGRVLVYTYQPRENYHAGMAVCSAPGGTVDIMTREEIKEYPDCIIGIVSEIPQYETWGSDNVDVDGRIWIKVK